MRGRGLGLVCLAGAVALAFLAPSCGSGWGDVGQVPRQTIRLRVHEDEEGRIRHVECLDGPLVVWRNGVKLTLRPVWRAK